MKVYSKLGIFAPLPEFEKYVGKDVWILCRARLGLSYASIWLRIYDKYCESYHGRDIWVYKYAWFYDDYTDDYYDPDNVCVNTDDLHGIEIQQPLQAMGTADLFEPGADLWWEKPL
jgi:hypothetical protein